MIIVNKPGLLTSIQDKGRYGFQKYGVVASGVMDNYAHRIANLLVGNDEEDAVIEISLTGPELFFEEPCTIAICGGDFSPHLNGKAVGTWRPLSIQKDSVLTFKAAKKGCRAYIALAEGLAIEEVLDSKSTYLRGQLGGFGGRALQANDKLRTKQSNKTPLVETPNWFVASDYIPVPGQCALIRAIKGRQYDWFSEDSKKALFSSHFTVTNESDRMGYRLNGAKLELDNAEEMISEAVSFGTIQVPGEGNPIVLLADRQTTGGYPKIGQIATVDLPVMAQLKPGDQLRFVEITIAEAQRLWLEQERQIQMIKQALPYFIY
ncbi:MAG: biotin-dependent carboxyltransferase family protein [Bacillus sp. (in: firmicutes)]